MMIVQRVLIVWGVLLCVGLLRADDLENRIRQFENQMQRQRTGRIVQIDKAKLAESIESIFDGVDPRSLTAEQIDRVYSSSLLSRYLPPAIATILIEKMETLSHESSDRGAAMATLRLYRRLNRDVQTVMSGKLPREKDKIRKWLDEQVEHAREVRQHPGFDDAVCSGKVDRYFECISRVMLANTRPQMIDDLLSLEKHLSSSLPANTVIAFSEAVENFHAKIKGKQVLAAADFQRLRLKLLTAMHELDAKLLDESEKSRLAATQKYMTQGMSSASQLVGRMAPGLDFAWCSRENWTNLNNLRGKIVVVDFWAVGCVGCIRNFDELRRLREKYADTSVEIVGVTSVQGAMLDDQAKLTDTRDNPEKEYELMREFMNKHNITWPVAFSEGDLFDNAFGVGAIPHYTIIAPDGSIVFNGTLSSGGKRKLAETIEGLLEEFGQ